MFKVILPALSEGIEKATISFWYHKEGEQINKDEDLVELVTDKAVFNLPSPCSGIIREIFFKEGQTVDIGEVIALIEEEK